MNARRPDGCVACTWASATAGAAPARSFACRAIIAGPVAPSGTGATGAISVRVPRARQAAANPSRASPGRAIGRPVSQLARTSSPGSAATVSRWCTSRSPSARGAALAEAAEADDIARIGRDLWAWHDPDAALAALVSDSADAPTAGVRSAGEARLLRFAGDEVSVEAEVIDGHVRGLALATRPIDVVEAHTAAGAVATAAADQTGWFDLTVPPDLVDTAALLRLRVADAEGHATWTAWFRC